MLGHFEGHFLDDVGRVDGLTADQIYGNCNITFVCHRDCCWKGRVCMGNHRNSASNRGVRPGPKCPGGPKMDMQEYPGEAKSETICGFTMRAKLLSLLTSVLMVLGDLGGVADAAAQDGRLERLGVPHPLRQEVKAEPQTITLIVAKK